MIADIFCPHTPLTLGSKVEIELFQNIVMLQIKRESQMQQHGSKYFACIPHPGVGVNRSKFNFQNMAMLHIKLIYTFL